MSIFGGNAWQDMNSAPRDGSEIEIKCSYGLEPSYSSAWWAQDAYVGPVWQLTKEPHVTYVNDVGKQPHSNGACNSSLQWRPMTARRRTELKRRAEELAAKFVSIPVTISATGVGYDCHGNLDRKVR